MGLLTGGASPNYQRKAIANELAQGIAAGLFKTTGDMLAAVDNGTVFLEVPMEPVIQDGRISFQKPRPSKRKDERSGHKAS